ALAIARQAAPDVPFIFLSGTLGEEVAIESLKTGATDYVIKDRLSRLGPSVKRALRESARERERREAESALKESQKRLELSLQASGTGVWAWEAEVDRFSADARMLAILEVSADQFQRDLTSFLSRLHEEDRDRVDSQLHAALERHGEFHAEYRVVRKDGTERHVASRGQFLPNETDGGSRAIGVCWDITDQKREEQRLRVLSTVLESAANAIMITGTDGRINWVNSAFAELTGYTLDDVLGQNPRLLKSGKHDEKFYREMWKTISGGATWHGQLVNRRKDGTLYTEEMWISPVRGPYGETASFVCMKRDITLEVDLTRQLHQAQRLEAVGRLAGGVAHDFNNILTVISGNAELALADLPSQDPTAEALREIREASRRAAALTRQLLAFSRKQILQPRVLDLNALVAGTEKMLRRLIGEDVKLSTRLQPNLGAIKADPGQLEQILMNLAVNARDAMPQGGELIFETENIEITETQAGQGGVRMHSGRYVRLTVTDTGHGMDEETRSRIFEPFFTTKAKGKGTGLGLSTVYGIVKQSAGYIWVESELEEGTSFEVYFPHVDGAPERHHGDATMVATSGGETILLVEDEETVLKLARSILERAGYTVIAANDGAEALRLIKEHREPIHLLVTDVVMPGMSGRALADSIQSLREGLPVVYTSGYTDDAIVHHGVLDSGTQLLEKPYSQSALLSAVRKILDSRSK
ncbi:MAG TPA: PAS domain S-box protein, partial [Vicinamibacteria bacterium]|nr:PAS domain S-box protein [Vicinamibacteria bacterium]